MKTAVSIAMMLLISTIAFSLALADDDDTAAIGNGGTDPGQYENQFIPSEEDPGAPNSGDGEDDGSGWYPGAPNAGDGVPDGSGWRTVDCGDSFMDSVFLLVLPFGVI